MNIYYCSYTDVCRGKLIGGAKLIIVAECESVALGLALETVPVTTKKDWIITKIEKSDTRKVYDLDEI
jgi:hypothetical protein